MSETEPSPYLTFEETVVLGRALRFAAKHLGQCEATLFGSRARRDHRTDSDYDLLLVPSGTPPKGYDHAHFLGEAERDAASAGIPAPLNIQVIPESRIEDAYFDFPFMRGVTEDGIDAKLLVVASLKNLNREVAKRARLLITAVGASSGKHPEDRLDDWAR